MAQPKPKDGLKKTTTSEDASAMAKQIVDNIVNQKESGEKPIPECFEQTKNRQKMEYQTHFLSNDRLLCPVRRLIDIIQRIYRHVPDVSPDTSLCTMLDDSLRPVSINNTFILHYLRSTCLDYGGTSTFGFAPLEIGNKSIRSGAAMALFMARHSPDRIMLLGRWKSTAFMDYLRPQSLVRIEKNPNDYEWAEAMANFMHVPDVDRVQAKFERRPEVQRECLAFLMRVNEGTYYGVPRIVDKPELPEEETELEPVNVEKGPTYK